VAVLPFREVADDRQERVFSAGLTEELTNQLARVNPEKVAVIASTNMAKYRSLTADINAIAREMGAKLILEGSVRRGKGRVRVTVQLVSASDQTDVWAGIYELPVRDSLAAQEEFAQKVVDAVTRCLIQPDVPEPSAVAKTRS
jgi:TolB-like protein